MVAATFKRTTEPDQNCAFLCHVSTRTSDHKHIENLLRKYKSDLATDLKARKPETLHRLKAAYDDLASTHKGIRNVKFSGLSQCVHDDIPSGENHRVPGHVPGDDIVTAIQFFSPGIAVKLVNGQTDEDVAVKSPYNLFVGGNKLGRGVTIKNLLVSYYGRNPKTPQADTVLQHARMYGYRRKDIGLLRLFLPRELHLVFKAINKMERALRELIGREPTEEFRGVYLEGGINATRKNVLAPGAVGVYSGGGTYNPAQVMRDGAVKTFTGKIDNILSKIQNKTCVEMPIEEIASLIALTRPDEQASEHVWDPSAIGESVVQFGKLYGQKTAFVYVDRDRGLKEKRHETQGILTGGEAGSVPNCKITLFMLRTKPDTGEHAAWWPQIRFPAGRYAFAFSV
jgi:hypothetical protein